MSSNTLTVSKLPDSVLVTQPRQTLASAMQGLAADGDRQQIAAPDGNGLPPGNARDVEKKDGVESAVSRISDFVQNFQRDLQFSVDRLSGRTVIKVVDSETNQVIRQIPSEESLRIARHLDSPDSLILSERA